MLLKKRGNVAKPIITLSDWCSKNNYPGINRACVMSAFQSDDPKIVELAKREKLKGLLSEEKEL